jgi:predicted nucleic-acid-binding protein
VNVIVDTNLLLRIVLNDDPEQSSLARKTFAEAERIAVTLPTLCEIVWVLKRTYRRSRSQIVETLRVILSIEKIVVDDAAVEAGLTMLEAGGDFADGVIAHEGRRLGGETFVTFDKDAAARLQRGGFRTLALA